MTQRRDATAGDALPPAVDDADRQRLVLVIDAEELETLDTVASVVTYWAQLSALGFSAHVVYRGLNPAPPSRR